jgi:hypothetical protein
MAHTPLKMTIAEVHAEVKRGWALSYSPEALSHAVASIKDKPLGYRINIFTARMCFRGIYFPQMGPLAWLTVIYQNRRTIFALLREVSPPGAATLHQALLPALDCRRPLLA